MGRKKKTETPFKAIVPYRVILMMHEQLRFGLSTDLRPGDAKRLRELLDFYFQTFNLQHNRLLMCVAQAMTRSLLQQFLCKKKGLSNPAALRLTQKWQQVLGRSCPLFWGQGHGHPTRALHRNSIR
eukprot:452471-Amphidinium_carterae.1